MFGSMVLEVIIGLIFLYLLLSLVCSAAKEGLEALMKKRAIDLERGIKEMLGGPAGAGMLKQVYDHPLIDGLFRGTFDEQKGGRLWSDLPSYIPAQNFAVALMDVVLRPPTAATAPPPPAPAAPPPDNANAQALQQFRSAINRIQNNDALKRGLLAVVDAAGNDISQVRINIEAWFNSCMDRVAGWYKRWSQWIIFLFGLVLVIILNVDTIAIGNRLVQDPSLRQSLVAAAQESVKGQPQDKKDESQQRLERELEELRRLGLPLGWNPQDARNWPGDGGAKAWVLKVVGLLLSVLAISLGAPFWFDVLNKFMVVRSTVKPEEKSPKEKSKN